MVVLKCKCKEKAFCYFDMTRHAMIKKCGRVDENKKKCDFEEIEVHPHQSGEFYPPPKKENLKPSIPVPPYASHGARFLNDTKFLKSKITHFLNEPKFVTYQEIESICKEYCLPVLRPENEEIKNYLRNLSEFLASPQIQRSHFNKFLEKLKLEYLRLSDGVERIEVILRCSPPGGGSSSGSPHDNIKAYDLASEIFYELGIQFGSSSLEYGFFEYVKFINHNDALRNIRRGIEKIKTRMGEVTHKFQKIREQLNRIS